MKALSLEPKGSFLRSRWLKRFSGSGGFGGVSVLTEDVPMRKKLAHLTYR
jgi:hypothetical protein